MNQTLTTITRNLQALYLKGLKTGTSRDFLGYYELIKDKLSPFEFAAVLQAYQAWLANRSHSIRS